MQVETVHGGTVAETRARCRQQFGALLPSALPWKHPWAAGVRLRAVIGGRDIYRRW